MNKPNWFRITLAYTFVAISMTYPLITQLTTHVAGDNSASSDVGESIWGLWWWRYALFTLHQSPLSITVLNHPQGFYFPLYPFMSQAFLLALPVTALTSPTLAYNIIFLLSLVASGLTGYALCLEVSRDVWASFVGGLIWAVFPSKMIHGVAGHLPLIFLFSIPLATLGLLRTLKEPSFRLSVLTGLALALVGTIHPIYLVYVVVPLTLVLLGHAWQTAGWAFWQRKKLLALGGVGSIAVGLLLLLAFPALRQWQQDPQTVWTASPDVTGFSPDALGYFIPSVDNPLIQLTSLTSFAVQVMPYQYAYLIYVGWAPLILAVVGSFAQPAVSQPWRLLAIGGAIFALGPLLKLGGDYAQVVIAGEPYRIVLPYAWVVNWPIVQWSRTPGRLTVLVMLAVAVLATLGLSALLKKFNTLRNTPWGVGLVAAWVMLEYIVRLPFPSFPASLPSFVSPLALNTEPQAILQLPMDSYQDNQRALFWQTGHQHPLIGGRVYRDQPQAAHASEFYRQLLLTPTTAALSPAQLWAMLNVAQIGWVIYDASAEAAPFARAQLEKIIGPPQAEDEQGAVFKVPVSSTEAPFHFEFLGESWSEVITATETVGRQFCQHGTIGFFIPQTTEQSLSVWINPPPATHRLTLQVNGQPLRSLVVGEALLYSTEPVTLRAGLNLLELTDQGPVVPTTATPPAACGANGQWGPLIAGVSPTSLESLTLTPEVVFGDALRLLRFITPVQATLGHPLTLHLVWQALEPLEDLTVFVHLLNAKQELVAQQDQPPLGSGDKTSTWIPGEVVAASVTLALPSTLPSGEYELALGVYRQTDLERLPLAIPAAPDNMLRLGPLTLRP